MIRRLLVSNYRSLGDVEIEFGALTAFVGINGAGKSNIVDCLRFLSECVRMGLDPALAKRGGLPAVRRWSGGRPFDCNFWVDVEAEGLEWSWTFTLAATAGDAFSVKHEAVLIQRKNGDDLLLEESFRHEGGKWQKRPEGVDPHIDGSSLALPLLANDKRFAPLADALRNIAVYSIFPDALREPQRPDPSRPMDEHGRNWSSILKSLHKEKWKPDFLAALGRIVGDIDDVRVTQAGTSFLVTEFRHGVENGNRARWFDAARESDGTLRLAGILTALLQEPPLTLLGVEEPELTIHPGALPVLYDLFKEASTRSQVVLTTHSPELLDLIGLEDLRIVERKDAVTSVSRVDSSQRELVRQRLMSPSGLLYAEGLKAEPPPGAPNGV